MKNYRSTINYIFFFVCLTLSTLCFSQTEVSGQVDEISWQSTTVKPPISLDKASGIAISHLGLGDIKPNESKSALVQVRDDAPFDGSGSTVSTCWLLYYTDALSIKNSNTGKKEKLSINVLVYTDASQKYNILAVFTDFNTQNWIVRHPEMNEQSVYEQTEMDGWTIKTAEQYTVNVNVSSILDAFWSTTGFNPVEAGQLFMRPRYVSLLYPAKQVENKLIPVSKPGVYWTVQLSGTKTAVRNFPPGTDIGIHISEDHEQEYMSGLIKLYSVDEKKFIRGIYLH